MIRAQISTKEQFEDIIRKNLIVVLYFFKHNCDKCHQLSEKLKREFESHVENVPGLAIVEINIDDSSFFMKYFKITAVPVIMVFFKGQVVWFKEQDDDCNVYETDRFIGYNPDLPYYVFKMVEHLVKNAKN